jgi:hypothetical protein
MPHLFWIVARIFCKGQLPEVSSDALTFLQPIAGQGVMALRFNSRKSTSFQMKEPVPPAMDLPDTADTASDRELKNLLVAHPWLQNLEPYSINWELIWVM